MKRLILVYIILFSQRILYHRCYNMTFCLRRRCTDTSTSTQWVLPIAIPDTKFPASNCIIFIGHVHISSAELYEAFSVRNKFVVGI